MKCPSCNTVDLLAIQRQDVEIDRCPHCRGVWLGRDQLEKLIERSARPETYLPPEERLCGRRHGERASDEASSHDAQKAIGIGRRKSWLSAFFD